MPPHAALMQMLTGKWVSSAISTAATIGIADHLEAGPKTASELAALTKTNPSALYRLLRALAGFGIFQEGEGQVFSQTPLSEPLRTSAKPGLRNMAMMFIDDWHVDAWKELQWTVETGRPAPYKLYGMGGFDYFVKHPEKAVNFNNAMSDLSQAEAPAIAGSYHFSGFKHIVDIGGGLGTLLAAILERNPSLRGTVYDLPYVIDQARTGPILAPFSSRCQCVGGSFFEAVPPSDAIIMKHIIHDWDDEKAQLILSNCRKAIDPQGKLLVVDQVVGPPNVPELAKVMDLEMLVAPGGLERTEDQWTRLFTAAGFKLTQIIATPGPQKIIEGVPA